MYLHLCIVKLTRKKKLNKIKYLDVVVATFFILFWQLNKNKLDYRFVDLASGRNDCTHQTMTAN